MKKFYYTPTDSGRMFLWSVLAPQILGAVFLSVLMFASGTEEAYKGVLENQIINVMLTMLAQIAFVIVFFTLNRRTNYVRACKINIKIGWINLLVCILIAVIGVFGINPIISQMDNFLTYIGYDLTTAMPLPLDNFGWFVLNIILLAGVPAVVEELIFRGVILNGYKKLGAVPAILISSALFALIHGSAQQLLFPFLFGLILGFVALKTGSVVSSIVVHFLNNALVVLFNYVGFNYAFNLPIWAEILISLAMLALTFVIVWVLGNLLKNVDKKKDLSEEDQQAVLEIQKSQISSNQPIIFGTIIAGLLLILEFLTGLGVIA